MIRPKTSFLSPGFFIMTVAVFFLLSPAARAEDRTANRSVADVFSAPDRLTTKPPFSEFTPYSSNHDTQNMHPQQWHGQDWDPSAWNPQIWTPSSVVKGFYKNHTFVRQYMRDKIMPVLVVGPTFYKLSDLDQRRCLKMLATQSKIFIHGAKMIELRDWYTGKVVGSYTTKGMLLK